MAEVSIKLLSLNSNFLNVHAKVKVVIFNSSFLHCRKQRWHFRFFFLMKFTEVSVFGVTMGRKRFVSICFASEVLRRSELKNRTDLNDSGRCELVDVFENLAEV